MREEDIVSVPEEIVTELWGVPFNDIEYEDALHEAWGWYEEVVIEPAIMVMKGGDR